VRIPDLEPKEKVIEARLRNAIKKMGGRAYKFVSPAHKSVPDRLILLPDRRIYFAEVKRRKGKLTKHQANEIDFIKSLGFDADVLYGVEGVKDYIWLLENGIL